jgi:hypothetical protein
MKKIVLMAIVAKMILATGCTNPKAHIQTNEAQAPYTISAQHTATIIAFNQ